jgi:hypothetical protein
MENLEAGHVTKIVNSIFVLELIDNMNHSILFAEFRRCFIRVSHF